MSEIQVWALGIGIHAVLTTSSDLTFKLSDWDFSLRPFRFSHIWIFYFCRHSARYSVVQTTATALQWNTITERAAMTADRKIFKEGKKSQERKVNNHNINGDSTCVPSKKNYVRTYILLSIQLRIFARQIFQGTHIFLVQNISAYTLFTFALIVNCFFSCTEICSYKISCWLNKSYQNFKKKF